MILKKTIILKDVKGGLVDISFRMDRDGKREDVGMSMTVIPEDANKLLGFWHKLVNEAYGMFEKISKSGL